MEAVNAMGQSFGDNPECDSARGLPGANGANLCTGGVDERHRHAARRLVD
jgi:hypothetical protein